MVTSSEEVVDADIFAGLRDVLARALARVADLEALAFLLATTRPSSCACG